MTGNSEKSEGTGKMMLGKLYICEALEGKWEHDWRKEVIALLGRDWELVFQPPGVEQRIRRVSDRRIMGIVVSSGMFNTANSYGWGTKERWPGLIRDDIITRYIEIDIAHALGYRMGSLHSWVIRTQEMRGMENG